MGVIIHPHCCRTAPEVCDLHILVYGSPRLSSNGSVTRDIAIDIHGAAVVDGDRTAIIHVNIAILTIGCTCRTTLAVGVMFGADADSAIYCDGCPCFHSQPLVDRWGRPDITGCRGGSGITGVCVVKGNQ